MIFNAATWICIAAYVCNFYIYWVRNKKYRHPRHKDDVVRYDLSWPTRIFKQLNYMFYLLTAVNIFLQPGPMIGGPPGVARLAAGAAMACVSIALLYSGSRALGENYKPCYSGIMPAARVRSGPYRYMNHPLYVANMLLFAGMTVLIPSALSVFLLLALAWVYYFTIRDENRALDARFPA